MRVFLSYRRDDTAGRAGRLHDALVSRLGFRNVFSPAAFDAVLVDGFATESPTCFSVLAADRDDVTPGSAASGLVGFNSTRDPTGAALALETESGVRIAITSGT
ncbi:MAG: hypothetical protein ACRDZM_16045 [Acidimicrobiia bacterium]